MRYPHLFSPFTLNKLTLRNRVVSTAHAEVYAEEGGFPGERYIRYYEEKARGGVGLEVFKRRRLRARRKKQINGPNEPHRFKK